MIIIVGAGLAGLTCAKELVSAGEQVPVLSEQYLRRLGFAEDGFIDNFARPFYRGIFLERSLATSARMFQFIFKMLATGDTILPAEGMQSISEQLAAALPEGSVIPCTGVSSPVVVGMRRSLPIRPLPYT